ncbi:glutathione S-transferase [Pseudooceanicola sp. 216_PA32_1]|uniref:Glutathione S-transferase n=1 Tax=Pseudooceanicola pacificus TaxID=2676438 RepID=A0A844WCP8_9RHOB|nr:glutathione S-transferase family protein [Pseudooceanicola pacificus]MWB76469.1 glutathione S-transferase [Pseudooceanicola pacificus]
MLTFYHSPKTRSTRVLSLLRELGRDQDVETRIVSIPRIDGTGGRDPSNPHPDGKVPLLVHDGTLISETSAIMLYLTDMFPEAGLGPRIGDPLRGAYLTWLAWYGDVMEPVYVAQAAGLSHPVLHATFRDVPEAVERLRTALADGRPWLLGESFTAADLLVHSPYAWFREATPQDPVIANWVDRCMARPAALWALEQDSRARVA